MRTRSLISVILVSVLVAMLAAIPALAQQTTKPKGVPQSDGRASASGQQAEGMVSTAGGGAKNRGNSLLCPSEGK
jgi:hypothetical protein